MKEHGVRKALSITLIVLVATVAAGTAEAAEPTMGERIIAQEKAKQIVRRPAPPTAIERLVAQEHGRAADARLFGPSASGPVLVASAPDGFDVGDAGIGGAATLAAALLAAAAVAFRNGNRRRRASGAASA
jgi:hypothetical protein